MVERSKDWLNQAERDIKQAEALLRDGFYEWACFAAQQASEKSVKALIQVLGGDVWCHSVTALIDAVPEGVRPDHLRDKALELDQAYIPSRYPNAHPVGFPGRFSQPVDRDSDFVLPYLRLWFLHQFIRSLRLSNPA